MDCRNLLLNPITHSGTMRRDWLEDANPRWAQLSELQQRWAEVLSAKVSANE